MKKSTLLYAVLLSTLVGTPGTSVAQQPSLTADDITFSESAQKISVKIGDDLFTEYHKTGFRKPILYPVMGPGQVTMTRSWPMKKDVEGEAHDHPHHKSVWFAHVINGIDFWMEKGGRVIVKKVKVDDKKNEIHTVSSWVKNASDNSEGEPVFSDITYWGFGHDETSRWIDATIKIQAMHGDITFGDTKEGTFAIRTHPDLRLTPSPGEGVTEVFGTAVNSNGITGKDIWGKTAKWVLYMGPIEGKPMSLAVFDHPENLRHPTIWHARDYGLVAANPFGLHDFLGKEEGEGAFTVKQGDTLTLRYRLLFIEGIATIDQIEERYAAFAE